MKRCMQAMETLLFTNIFLASGETSRWEAAFSGETGVLKEKEARNTTSLRGP